MDHTILTKYQTIEIKNTSKTSKKSSDSMMFGMEFLGPKNLNQDRLDIWYPDILILDSAGGHFKLWRPSCINKYNVVYKM